MNLASRLAARLGWARWWPGCRALRCTPGLPDRARSLTPAALRLLATDGPPPWRPEPAGHVIDLSADAPPGPVPHLAGDPRRLRADLAARCGADDILLTHGPAGAFTAWLDAWVRPGTRVVVPVPCPPLFLDGLRTRRARVRFMPTWADAGRLRWDAAQMSRALQRAEWLVMADPANPLGAAVEDWHQLANGFKGRLFLEATSAPEAFAGRTVTAGCLASELGRAGLGVGWLAAPPAELAAMRCVVEANAMEPSGLAVSAASGLWARHDADAARREAADRARWACEMLEAAGLEPARPAGGRLAWLPTAALGLTGERFARELLSAEEVLVRPGDDFGPGGLDGVRLSLHGDAGRVREGLRRVARFARALLGHDPAPEPVAEPVPAGAPNFDRHMPTGGPR